MIWIELGNSKKPLISKANIEPKYEYAKILLLFLNVSIKSLA